MSYRGRGRGGFHNSFGGGVGGGTNQQNNNRANFGHHSQQQQIDAFTNSNQFPVEIMGWSGASSSECINFISRKCKVVVQNYSVDSNTGILKGYVKNEQQANLLLNWSGVKFAGQSLRFIKGTSNQASTTTSSSSTIETITQFLKTRYNPEIKMLNLSNVKQDPALNTHGFFSSVSITAKFFPALFKVANDLSLEVISIDLSNNELSELNQLVSLPQSFPKLQNLSFQNNQFNRIKVFETWKNKLNNLRELIIFDNPIVININTPQDINNLKLEFMKLFPRLVVLNGEILRDEPKLNMNLTFPFDSNSMFFENDDSRNLATNFLANFFKLWDSNRGDLMILYQNESQFSMQVDTSHPYLIDSNNSTDFGNYLSNSRNLTRVSGMNSRMNKLAIGQEAIFKSFQQLPKTQHELINKPNLFSVECYKFPSNNLNGLIITIHGIFEEIGQPELEQSNNNIPSGPRSRYIPQNKHKRHPLSKKCFDRTFTVIPDLQGSMIVASDLLLIRPYTSENAWEKSKEQPNITTQPQPVNTPSPAQQANIPSIENLPLEIKNNLSPMNQEILVKILIETKLTIQYALMLCEQSNWNYQLCMDNFKNSVASLPREAFV
ncbi:unnamed protein product [Candida verbasci]|uniref:mRNA export factor MEX67 n=1 Tax=Candida verbasci TaxID=1227364 RepID=A0A9W4XES7_9ASCO|nr:unnamed protein product [Candida verbasci]